MRYLFAMLAVLAGLAFGVPSSAQAAVTCTDYRTLNPTYPQNYPNNGHMYVCFTGYDSGRVTAILDAGGRTGHADNGLMSSKGVNYFYFKNRSDAISWTVLTSQSTVFYSECLSGASQSLWEHCGSHYRWYLYHRL